MTCEQTDLELVEEFKNGDQAAFETLTARYGERVFNLAMRLTKNTQDAEEVWQDVFVTVFRKVEGFEGRSTFSSWLYRITVNAAFMVLRKRKQDRNISIEDVLPQIRNTVLLKGADNHTGEKLTSRKELLQALEDAISKLPDDYRPVFILRDVDGLTSREVGKILNISIPAVKSRLHRSRMMLRKRLASVYQDYRSELPLDRAGSVGNM